MDEMIPRWKLRKVYEELDSVSNTDLGIKLVTMRQIREAFYKWVGFDPSIVVVEKGEEVE